MHSVSGKPNTVVFVCINIISDLHCVRIDVVDAVETKSCECENCEPSYSTLFVRFNIRILPLVQTGM